MTILVISITLISQITRKKHTVVSGSVNDLHKVTYLGGGRAEISDPDLISKSVILTFRFPILTVSKIAGDDTCETTKQHFLCNTLTVKGKYHTANLPWITFFTFCLFWFAFGKRVFMWVR